MTTAALDDDRDPWQGPSRKRRCCTALPSGFVAKEKDEYLVAAEAPVKGTALTPQDQVKVRLGN